MKNIIRNLNLIIALIVALLLVGAAKAQTNQFYASGDLTLSIGPVVSFPVSSAKIKKDLFGGVYQTTLWQTATGTGLEIGKRDFSQNNNGFIDHITAMEYYRAQPLAQSPLFGRWSIYAGTGAETWFTDGSKGVLISGGTRWAFTKVIYAELQGRESFETKAANSGGSVLVDIGWRF